MTNAVYAINNFTWKVLQDRLDMSADNYGGRIPILPAAEQPDFEEYDFPVLVYSWGIEGQAPELYVSNIEVVGYAVYADSTGKVDNILQTLNMAYRGKDDSAANVNRWLNSPNNPAVGAFADFNFTYTNTTSLSAATPPQNEGGKYSGVIMVRYAYNVDVNMDNYRYV